MDTPTTERHRCASTNVRASPSGNTETDHAIVLQQVQERLSQLDEKMDAVLGLVSGATKPSYTVEEVAELTGRSDYTVRRWHSQGLISATRVAGTGPRGRLLIPRTELQRLISSGRGSAVPEAVIGGGSRK